MSSFGRVAEGKRTILDNASGLKDLFSPAGDRLERLKGERAGQHSIELNDQGRIYFVWMSDGPIDLAITDYH